jgi:hypothetical protein
VRRLIGGIFVRRGGLVLCLGRSGIGVGFWILERGNR